MRLSTGVLILGSLSTSLALPSLKPFTGAITSWLDPLGQLPLFRFAEQHSTEDKSIFDVISNDDKFTKITKVIKFAEGIETVLKDSDSSITFFAVPDSALKSPRDDHPHGDLEELNKIVTLEDAVQALDSVDHDHDDHDKERKKKILKRIVTGILNYHILPDKLSGVDLGKNNTFATNLVLPESFDERALRIRVSSGFRILPPPPGGLTVNWYSHIVHQDKAASNGVIHVVDRPLLPPPALFQELFFLPGLFSTLTSAIQRTGLTDVIDLRFEKGKDDDKGHLRGSKAATIFAPTNRAFNKLPPKLQFFLFSPFGTRVLGKLLQYHVVPNYIFHTDYVHNGTTSESFQLAADPDVMPLSPEGGFGPPSHPLQFHSNRKGDKHCKLRELEGGRGPEHGPISSHKVILPTALENHTIHAEVEKVFVGPRIPHHPRRIATILKVNHRLVPFPDSVGFNGAVHVIDKILDPRGHGDHHHDHDHDGHARWDDWEDWLVKWADKA